MCVLASVRSNHFRNCNANNSVEKKPKHRKLRHPAVLFKFEKLPEYFPYFDFVSQYACALCSKSERVFSRLKKVWEAINPIRAKAFK